MTELMLAAGYICSSNGQQTQAAISIERQRQGIKRDAARRGYVIIEWYVDNRTVGRLCRQPDLRFSIDDACSPSRPYHALFVASSSRLPRDASVHESYRRELERHGVRLLSAEKSESSLAG